MKLNKQLVFFTGGGTGGHIYPGLAVADELKNIANKQGINIKIGWIGCSKGMDKQIVENAKAADGKNTADFFYGIPSGKLRRYFSLKNLTDLFRITAGFFKSFFILYREEPALLFSKGGFVSVPPCLAAHLLHIPVYTHECDFTLGLANRINFKSADCMFVSYEDTKNRLSEKDKKRVVVTGNPVRPVFYSADSEKGRAFLGIKNQDDSNTTKPILLVLGGSSGARQINNLVYDNIDYLCKNFIVVHQTGLINTDEDKSQEFIKKYQDAYKPYSFIYSEMPDVVCASDIILSRAGANSLWESAVLLKPMLLVPLCGSGTRGDQVDNAKFFKEKCAAEVLLGDEADSSHLISALENIKTQEKRSEYSNALKNILPEKNPAIIISEILLQKINGAKK